MFRRRGRADAEPAAPDGIEDEYLADDELAQDDEFTDDQDDEDDLDDDEPGEVSAAEDDAGDSGERSGRQIGRAHV